MKTVLLLRHAKSDWSDGSLRDFERPLAKRGRNDAPLMGEVLLQYEAVPDKILSSPAKRAKQTAELVAEACGYKKSIDWHDTFYGASSDDLIIALTRLPNTVERAMLVGHNPTMEETVAALLVGYSTECQDEFYIKVPTAGLICLDLHILDWATLEPGDAVLRWFVIPRLIKSIV